MLKIVEDQRKISFSLCDIERNNFIFWNDEPLMFVSSRRERGKKERKEQFRSCWRVC